MRRHEIQAVYLDIQSNLGRLIEEATDEEKSRLTNISVQLVNVKRKMIGNFDEIETDLL